MCVCTPNIRTPWCGKPGCQPPTKTPTGTRMDERANYPTPAEDAPMEDTEQRTGDEVV